MKVSFHPQFFKDCNKLFSNNPLYYIPRLFANAKFRLRMAWQRIFRGYDDNWNWGLFHQLNEVAPKCLRKMKKGMGHPAQLKSLKEWHDILEKMAKGFEASEKIEKDWLYKGKRFEKLKAQRDKGLKLFIKHYESLWD